MRTLLVLATVLALGHADNDDCGGMGSTLGEYLSTSFFVFLSSGFDDVRLIFCAADVRVKI